MACPALRNTSFSAATIACPAFLDDDDRQRYLTLLGEALLDTGCKLHAYVLMDNHGHPLVSPPAIGAIGCCLTPFLRKSTR